MTAVTVIKRNLQGEETWRYTGHILRRDTRSRARLALEELRLRFR